MPVKTKTESWVQTFREQLKSFMAPKAAWYVQESRGKIRLLVKEDGKTQTLTLENDWSLKGATESIKRISLIYKNFYSDLGNRSLEKSATVVDKSSSNSEIDFKELFIEFRAFCPSASEETWNKSYVPVLRIAQELLERSQKKPQNGEELMTYSLKKWEMGSRSRQIARRALQKFLDWAILRGKLPRQYAPVQMKETLKKKRIGYALREDQILQLIASEKDPRWQFNFQLLAVYGLRPEELRFLVIKDGVRGKELWTTYEKSMGGTKGQKTEPRKLAPLLIKDGKGFINWNLQERLEKDEALAPIGKEGKASDALKTRLSRNPVWNKFKKQAEKQKEVLVPYAFRHRYAKIAHSRSVEMNLSIKDIAFVMGHTVEVHQQNYARFMPEDTHAKFEKQIAA